MAQPVALYDEFSDDYDRFIDWRGRLALEMPFIEQQLRQVGGRRVLDAACGTGQHALALAERGYEVVGADLSAPMIERARASAHATEPPARFEVAGFGQLAARLGAGFDAVVCLGNSLPHALTAQDLRAALDDFVACLRPGGLLLIQNRNFDAVLAQQQRWMEPQAHREGEREWLFLRCYDFLPDGLLAFNVITLRRIGGGAWQQRVASTRLRPNRCDELVQALGTARFARVSTWGNMQGQPFDAQASSNLVLAARKN